MIYARLCSAQTMSNSKSKELEKLVHRLLKIFPTADSVEHDVRIRGASGGLRQIDVLIRQKIGPVDFTIVVDTKYKHKRAKRIDVLTVDDIRKDIGANLAVVVAPLGFDKGAIAYGRDNAVQLLRSINSSDTEWVRKLTAPLAIHFQILAYWTDRDLPKPVNDEFVKHLIQLRDSNRLPSDISEVSYEFSLEAEENNGELSGATISYQELNLIHMKNVPLSFFGLLKETSRDFYTEGFKTIMPFSEIMTWPKVTFNEIPTGTGILILNFIKQASRREGRMVAGIGDIQMTFEVTPQNSSMNLKSKHTAMELRISFQDPSAPDVNLTPYGHHPPPKQQ